MLYISGQNDTVDMLFDSTLFNSPAATFLKLNPELCSLYPNCKSKIPPYVPIFLEQPQDPSIRAEAVRGIMQFSSLERATLRDMQENQYDILTQLALTDIMVELQQYAKGFRSWLKAPLIVTPWTELNSSFTDKSLFKMCGETFKYGSEQIKRSPQFMAVDRLYEDMMARDVLNRQLHMIRKQKGSALLGTNRDLEKQIKELTARIKQELPKKLSKLRTHYLSKGFTDVELRKMRANSFSAKGARNGKLVTTNLDVLNRSGLSRLKTMINGFKKIGTGINKASTMLNYGVVAYDTAQAYKTSGGRDAAKTFITGAGAVFLTSKAVSALGGTASLGGLVLGSLAGDVAIGATLLISSPVLGWIIVVIAGAAVGGFIGYKAKGVLEEAWDFTEVTVGWLSEVAIDFATWANKDIANAWSSTPGWVFDFYNKNP